MTLVSNLQTHAITLHSSNNIIIYLISNLIVILPCLDLHFKESRQLQILQNALFWNSQPWFSFVVMWGSQGSQVSFKSSGKFRHWAIQILYITQCCSTTRVVIKTASIRFTSPVFLSSKSKRLHSDDKLHQCAIGNGLANWAAKWEN